MANHQKARRRTKRPAHNPLPPGTLRAWLDYAGTVLAKTREAHTHPDGRHLTLEEVGVMLGLSTSAVGTLEKPPVPPPGKKQQVPSLENLLHYAYVLHLDLGDLFPADPDSPYAQLRRALADYVPEATVSLTALLQHLPALRARVRPSRPQACDIPA